jgi:DNA-directed RNA polymerase sigma subunit (sigma70/sigma32)
MSTQTYKAGGPGRVSETTLFQQAQAGCSVSLNSLMTRHDGLVQVVVRQQVLGDLPFTEALQAGRLGLWRAILGFDLTRGLAFSTYAWPSIMRQVWRAVKLDTRFHALPAIDDGVSHLETLDPSIVWEVTTVRQALHDLVQRLPRRLQEVVVTRYGLDGHPPASIARSEPHWD